MPPNAARIARRVAEFRASDDMPPAEPSCQEENDHEPKEVQPLNGGFFALEAMRQQNVAETKAREERRGKLREQ